MWQLEDAEERFLNDLCESVWKGACDFFEKNGSMEMRGLVIANKMMIDVPMITGMEKDQWFDVLSLLARKHKARAVLQFSEAWALFSEEGFTESEMKIYSETGIEEIDGRKELLMLTCLFPDGSSWVWWAAIIRSIGRVALIDFHKEEFESGSSYKFFPWSDAL